jgi:hypothetical protein
MLYMNISVHLILFQYPVRNIEICYRSPPPTYYYHSDSHRRFFIPILVIPQSTPQWGPEMSFRSCSSHGGSWPLEVQLRISRWANLWVLARGPCSQWDNLVSSLRIPTNCQLPLPKYFPASWIFFYFHALAYTYVHCMYLPISAQ